MNNFLVRTLLVVFFLSVSSAVFAQQYIAGYRASTERDSFLFNITTPKDWVCDFTFAEYAQVNLSFLLDEAYDDDGVDTSYFMFVASYEGRSLSAQKFIQNDIEDMKKKGVKVTAKKLDIKLDNATNWKDYGLYELSGMPGNYKELMLVIQTEKANVYVVYARRGDSNDRTKEAGFQENSNGFYEMIKTIFILELVGWGLPSDVDGMHPYDAEKH